MRIKSKAIIICEVYKINSKAKAVTGKQLYDLQFVEEYNLNWNTSLNPKLKKAFLMSKHYEPTFGYGMFHSYLHRQATDRKTIVLKRFKKDNLWRYYI